MRRPEAAVRRATFWYQVLRGLLWPVGIYGICHLIESQFVTPYLVGARLLISPFLVFLSFTFWFWLWGPIGAILATPILVIVNIVFEVLGDYRTNIDLAASADIASDDEDMA